MKIVYRKTSDLIPYVNNARTHDEEQVTQIASSIKEFGFTNPVLIDQENGIIAGHGRVRAAQKLNLDELPCIVLKDLSEAQKKAYIIADNKLALNSGWNEDLLKIEIEELQGMDFDIDLLGFDSTELDDILSLADSDNEGLTDPDEVPEPPGQPVNNVGDVWQLGKHRLMCGDSTIKNNIEILMNHQKASLLHSDPPYGMGKEKDGVLNDNLYRDKLYDFQRQWLTETRLFIKDNASVYIWGNSPDLWRLWYGYIEKSEPTTYRNHIIWDKGSGQGMGSDSHRMYVISSESCFFYVLGVQGFNNNADNYFSGWDTIRLYLLEEVKKTGLTRKELAKILGHSERLLGHYIDKSQFELIPEHQYLKFQNYFKNNKYDVFKKEYDEIKKEFYSTRSYFDNTHDIMTDVWRFNRVTGEYREGHPTPKPVKIAERIIKTSTENEGICLDPFGGSGSTMIACETTGRACYMMELAEHYCDVIIKRWQDFTGKEATLEATGQTFEERRESRE